MGRESLRIHASVFWSRTSPSNFYDMLLMSQSIERLPLERDTIIVLLPHLGFVINFKNSVMEPVQTIQYSGFVINSIVRPKIENKEKQTLGKTQEMTEETGETLYKTRGNVRGNEENM